MKVLSTTAELNSETNIGLPVPNLNINNYVVCDNIINYVNGDGLNCLPSQFHIVSPVLSSSNLPPVVQDIHYIPHHLKSVMSNNCNSIPSTSITSHVDFAFNLEKENETNTTAANYTNILGHEEVETVKMDHTINNRRLHQKFLRNSGKEYKNVSGKLILGKVYDDIDCCCKNNCLSKLGSRNQREHIFERFWNIGNYIKQNVYLVKHVETCRLKNKKHLSIRNYTKSFCRKYNVYLDRDEKERVRVCKTMFLNLHKISNGRLDRVLRTASSNGTTLILGDKRGRHCPHNKTKDEDLEFVKKHIIHFKQSLNNSDDKNRYSIIRMYNLYRKTCHESNRNTVGIWVYRNTEKSLFPKDETSHKDACNIHNSINIDFIEDTNQDKGSSKIIESVTDPNTHLLNIVKQEHHTQEAIRIEQNNCMNKEVRKKRRNKGESYINFSGNLVLSKVYRDADCNCKYYCIPRLGTLEKRKEIFEDFWRLGDFTKQNKYLANLVALQPISHRVCLKNTSKQTRAYTRQYTIQFKNENSSHRICKSAFLSLHGVSNGRVDRVMQSVSKSSLLTLQDRRGQHPPKNKTAIESENYASNHILKIINEGQLNQNKNLHLHKDNHLLNSKLNVESMYRSYLHVCQQDNVIPISNFVYRKLVKLRL